MSSFAGLNSLEEHLATRTYVAGDSRSPEDIIELTCLNSVPNPQSFPHAHRWSEMVTREIGAVLSNEGPYMPWTGSSRITFKQLGDAGEDIEFTAVEISGMLESAYKAATDVLKSIKGTVMPDIEMKFQPQLSANTGANEGHNRDQQPDLSYIRLQMDRDDADDIDYLARWYLSALEASFLDKKVQSLLSDFKAEHVKFGARSDTIMSYEVDNSNNGDNTTTTRKTISIQIRESKISKQPEVEKAVKELIVDITSNINCGFATLATLVVAPRKGNAQRQEIDEKAVVLTRNLFDWCNNIANLTPSFLYMHICDRVISVERQGLYVDDLGFLIDVQLQVTSMLYNDQQCSIHDYNSYLERIFSACQQRSPQVSRDSINKYFQVKVDGGKGKIRLLEHFYTFRRDHFNEDKVYNKNLVVKMICNNHYLIQKCGNWDERTRKYSDYVARYRDKHITLSGDRGYRRYYEIITREEGKISLVKSIYAIHENNLWDKFEIYDWGDKDRYKGPSYPDFAEMMASCGLSDKDLVCLLRNVLRLRRDLDLSAGIFLPNVAVMMFFAEVARFSRSYISALMMLDLIENERPSYSWQSCFYMKAWNDGWSASREGQNDKKKRFQARDMFGKLRFYQTVQGKYTMSNLNSSGVSAIKKIEDRPELQKESSIAIDWLAFDCASRGYNVVTSNTELSEIDKTPPVVIEGTAKAELQQRLIHFLTTRAVSVGELDSLSF